MFEKLKNILLEKARTSWIALVALGWLALFSINAQAVDKAVSRGKSSLQSFRDCPDCPEMVIIPAGTFEMGSPSTEAGRFDSEDPMHHVEVHSFALGKNSITRGQFAAFVKATNYDTGNECRTFEDGKGKERIGRSWRNSGFSQDDNHPVVCISWNDANEYAKWLSKQTGKLYRLPSEGEWEYAARAGTTTARYWGDSPDQACSYANVGDQALKEQVAGVTWEIHNCNDGFAYTAPVGTFKPNAFGLYDMQGNVMQWMYDDCHSNYNGAPSDGRAWTGNDASHIVRGGSWILNPRSVRSAKRLWFDSEYRGSNVGFRIAMTLQ